MAWRKYFADGSLEIGSDRAIEAKEASWSRGRLDRMIRAQSAAKGHVLEIQGPGEYWQSDDFVFTPATGESLLIRNRLQKKITPEDKHFCVLPSGLNSNQVIFNADLTCRRWVISPDNIGKWLTLEYTVSTNEFQWYISDRRI
jgi:hypothetical protein